MTHRPAELLVALLSLTLVACGPTAQNPRGPAQAAPTAQVATTSPPSTQTLTRPSAVPAAPLFGGQLTYVDAACNRVTLSLASGERRSEPLPMDTALDAPPCALPQSDFQLRATPERAVAGLSPGRLRAQSGEEAWIDPDQDGAQLHIRGPDSAVAHDYSLDRDTPSARSYALVAYVALEQRLLLTRSLGQSAGYGRSLLLVDPQTGVQQDLEIVALIEPEHLAIEPHAKERLVVIPMGGLLMGQEQCAMLVLNTRTLEHACVSRTMAFTPLWSPDGRWLAYATDSGAIALAASETLAAPPRTLPTVGKQTGLLTWIDDAHLLYVTYPPRDPLAALGSAWPDGGIFLLDTATGRSARLASEVGQPRCYGVCRYWGLVATYQPGP